MGRLDAEVETCSWVGARDDDGEAARIGWDSATETLMDGFAGWVPLSPRPAPT